MDLLEIFGKVIEVSHSNLEMTSRIKALLNIVSKTMGFDEIVLFTLDKDKRLTCRFSNQETKIFNVLSSYRCHLGEGVIGSVAQKRRPQFYTIEDVPFRFGCLFYPELDNLLDSYKTFSFMPLSDDSYLYGVMVLCSSQKEVISDLERVLLAILSREIGGALRVNDLIVSSKKRISELATLSELGKVLTSNTDPHLLFKNIGLIIAKSLNADFVTIKVRHAYAGFGGERYTYGEIKPILHKHIEAIEEEAASLNASTFLKEEVLLRDCSLSGYSICSAPICSKGGILGTITIGLRAHEVPFEENGRYIIDSIVHYITNGLENSLLNIKLTDVVRELANTQKRIIEQEKFKTLGEMTANIAHEIKNPLVIIGGFTKRLAKKMQLDQTENRYVNIITKEVERLEAILNGVLNYVKVPPESCELYNINECLDELIYLFASDSSWEKVRIIKEYDDTIPAILCDKQQIKQVFVNILINAFEAMEGEGEIRVKTTQQTTDGEQYVVVSITDTGGGIDPAIIENISNPFFTTKERGTGLGLAISNKIIINQGGKIEIKNMPGRGATFFIYLPVKK